MSSRITPRQLREAKRVLAKTLSYDEWHALNPSASPEFAEQYRTIRGLLEAAVTKAV